MTTHDYFYRVVRESTELDTEILKTMEEYEELFGREDYKDFDFEDWTIRDNKKEISVYGTDRAYDHAYVAYTFPIEFLFMWTDDRKDYVSARLQEVELKKKAEEEAKRQEQKAVKKRKEAEEYKQYLFLKEKFEGKENVD